MSTVSLPLRLTYIVIPIAAGFMILFAFLRAFIKLATYHAQKGDTRA